ncbi:MAG: helix-turn-helix domain-containing protein [Xanthobacteraceae bacterium]
MNELFRPAIDAAAPLSAGPLSGAVPQRDDAQPLRLPALRKRYAITQGELAEKLSIGRPAVCKLERRSDMHVSNLRRYVEALGGTLAITAHFPDGAVTIGDLGCSTTR